MVGVTAFWWPKMLLCSFCFCAVFETSGNSVIDTPRLKLCEMPCYILGMIYLFSVASYAQILPIVKWSKDGNQGWISSVVKSTCCLFRWPGTHSGELITTCNSSSRKTYAICWYLTNVQSTYMYTDRYRHMHTHKIRLTDMHKHRIKT